jgi:hypothetical protein
VSAYLRPAAEDPIRRSDGEAVSISVDGERLTGVQGQSIAGIILATGRLDWRLTSAKSRPRGVFCGIGVCFDCLVTVNDEPDVRACLRRAVHGDVVVQQHDPLPTPVEGSIDA